MTEPKRKTRLWLRVLLGTSLALNLLVLGVVAGAAFRFGHPDRYGGPPRSLGSALYRALPDEDRKHLWSNRTKGYESRRDRRFSDVEAVTAALRASPFDAGALDGILTEQINMRQAHHLALQKTWLDKIETMSEAERLAYADRLEAMMRRKGKGKWHK